MIDFVPVEHDPFEQPTRPAPAGRDPFALGPGEFWNSIPQTAVMRSELERVYSAGATGQHRTSNFVKPEDFGYQPQDVPGELMAEGGRAYLSNPNYFKAVAPKTAAAIRAAWNSNPTLSKILQFNTIPPILLGAGAAGYRLVPVDGDPFAQ
jgi:hypothetical protein